MTIRVFLQLLCSNIFLTKILANAPLKDSESAITTAGKYKPIHYNTHRNRTTTSPYE